MKQTQTLKMFLILLVSVVILSGCHMPYKARVEIQITNYEEGQSVVLGEETRIISIADTSKGVKSIQLLINGQLEHTTEPPEGRPLIYTADQPWTPQEEGLVQVSVLVLDTRGNLSDPYSINLQVVTSLGEAGETPTPEPTEIEGLSLTQTAQAGCTNGANFIQDITIPTNAFLSPNTNFTKIWRVNNSGTCDWAGYQIVHISGNLFSAQPGQALPLVSAGSDANISIEMVSPSSPGSYSSAWRIRSSDGTLFGPELSLLINIPEPTDTPLPTLTPTTLPTRTPTPTQTPSPTRTVTSAVPSVAQIDKQISINANSSDNLTVSCPAGSLVVSGGFAAQNGLRVWHSMKDGNGWRVYATNQVDVKRNLTVFTTCLFNSDGSVSQELFQGDAEPNTVTNLKVACPSGSLVTGGGWVIGSNNAIQIYNASKSDNGWQIYIDNTSSNTPLINVYAICLAGVGGTTTNYTNTSGIIPPGATASLEQACPGSSLITGGGFAINRGAVIYNTSKYQNGWINFARNTTLEEKLFYTEAICYSP